MTNPTVTVGEIYRVMKKGGIFIIKEHDVSSHIVRMLIDIASLISGGLKGVVAK
jgi:ubiquinone/menaquinone biosynthesis C-methylase UbiE